MLNNSVNIKDKGFIEAVIRKNKEYTMAGFFSRRKKVIQPPKNNIDKIQSSLDKVMFHLFKGMHIANMADMDSSTIKNFALSKYEIEEAKIHLRHTETLWKDGESVISELNRTLNGANNLIQNAENWANFLNSASFDLDKADTRSKYQHFVKINRKYAAIVDKDLNSAYNMFESINGIELKLYDEEDF